MLARRQHTDQTAKDQRGGGSGGQRRRHAKDHPTAEVDPQEIRPVTEGIKEYFPRVVIADRGRFEDIPQSKILGASPEAF